MTRIALSLLVLLLACQRGPERTFVVLAEGSTPLGRAPTRFRPATPLPAADDINGVCVLPPVGHELHTEWTLGLPGRPGVRVRAAAVLTTGDTVPLYARSWSDELCLATKSALLVSVTPPRSNVIDMLPWK